MSLTIDIHALQTLPPSLINRDDTGAPKSAIFGGALRQRVSSQSWKRAIRRTFEEDFDKGSVGFRTKRIVDLVVAKIKELAEGWDEKKAVDAVKAALKKVDLKLIDPPAAADDEAAQGALPKTDCLLFVSPRQITHLAQVIIDADAEGKKAGKKQIVEALDTDHSVDIAMFGRMVAEAPDFNVDASVQVAHAIGVHESEPEFDYFTAVDDVNEDEGQTGAGMIDTVQMMSSTLYRFATVDLASLEENLGDRQAAVVTSIEFLKAFITSLPTGKQNTFAHNTLPELVYIAVRDSRSISLVNAFEEPVTPERDATRREVAARRLAAEERNIEEAYGFVPERAFVLGLGELVEPFDGLAARITLGELADRVRGAIEGRA